jgi:CRISPR-associated protein Csh1
MLTTLIKLGSQLSHNRGEWDDIIDYPNIEKEKNKNITLYVAELIFDLDQHNIYLNQSLREYDEEKSCLEYKNIKIQGGNNKAIYGCVESGKLEQIRKTFFGIIDSKGNLPVSGQFQEAINKDFPLFKTTLLATLLPKIFNLRDIFEEKATSLKEAKGQEEKNVDEKRLISNIELSGNSKIVLFYVSVISAQHNIFKPTPISKIEGFEEFMKTKFLEKGEKITSEQPQKKISYATGLKKENVIGVEFPNRYSLNYMFVETTLNYASQFNKNNFQKNYQLNFEEQLFLERASKYILENQKIKIAGIDHCIIPQFLNSSDVDIKYITEGIIKKNELLFGTDSLGQLITSAENETDQPFWITYLAFESDGNFFKTINEIKDVSKLHFNKILDTFSSVNEYFKTELSDAVDWFSVTTDYGKQHSFNLTSIYSIIPIRKDKEKRNEALFLFKLIFENRKIDSQKLYKFFCDLILCHKYERYRSYTNVKVYEDKHFDFSVRDSVFKYFALIQALKQLNLLNTMEETELHIKQTPDNELIDHPHKIQLFLEKMNYDTDQKAMFHLGRMLSRVAYMQKDKNKTVLEKVNFSGMKLSDILRLRNSLMEKANQYKEMSKVIFSDAEFTQHFNYENWKMNPEEAVFFLLSGYSFGIIKSKDNN